MSLKTKLKKLSKNPIKGKFTLPEYKESWGEAVAILGLFAMLLGFALRVMYELGGI